MQDLTQQEIEHLLATQPVAHIGVIADGRPYVTPTSFVFVGGSLWFRTAEGRRLDAMRVDPRVCVEITRYHPYTGMWESVVAWGEARAHTDAREQLRVGDLLEEKYRDPLSALEGIPVDRTDEERIAVVEVVLAEMTGRAALRSGGGRTRPGRL